MIDLQNIVTNSLKSTIVKYEFNKNGYANITLDRYRKGHNEEIETKFLVSCSHSHIDLQNSKNILFVSNKEEWRNTKTRQYRSDIVEHCLFGGTPGFKKRHLDVTFESETIGGIPFIIAFQNNLDKEMQRQIIFRELKISDDIVNEHLSNESGL